MEEAGEKKISEYDLVLFGSGIYRMRIHKALRRFLEQLPKQEETPTIYFLTSGFDSSSYGEEFRDILSEKGFRILGGYRTLGWMTFGPVFFWEALIKESREKRRRRKRRRFFAARWKNYEKKGRMAQFFYYNLHVGFDRALGANLYLSG